MKKLVLLFVLAIASVSCDMGSDGESSTFVLGPVQDVTMPNRFKVDSTSQIMVRYKRPDDAHIFQGFYYQAVSTTRTVCIQYARLDQASPAPDDQVYEVPLNFRPSQPGTYIFKFWDGTNQDATDHFYVAEAVVNE